MTRSELITKIAAKSGLPRAACDTVIQLFTDEVKACLIKGDRLILKGFVKFEVVELPPRDGRDPRTGKVVTFPSTRSARCRICREIKDAVNAK